MPDPEHLSLHPATIVERSDPWTIAVNANQNLIGKTLLVLARQCSSVVELTAREWIDLHRQIGRVCAALDELFAPDLYHHAFLMNQDRQVHLHVVPRYATSRIWDGETFDDPHWGTLFGAEQRVLSEHRLSRLANEFRQVLQRA